MKKHVVSLVLFLLGATGALYAPVIVENGTPEKKSESWQASIEKIFDPVLEQLKPVGKAAANWVTWFESQATSLFGRVVATIKAVTENLWNQLQSFQSAKLSEKQIILARQKLDDLKNRSDRVIKNVLDQAATIANRTGLEDTKTIITRLMQEGETLDTEEKALKSGYFYAKVASDLAQKAIDNLSHMTIKSLENTIHAINVLIDEAQTVLAQKSNPKSASKPSVIHAKPSTPETADDQARLIQEPILFPPVQQ